MTERVFTSLRELPAELATQTAPQAASQNGQHTNDNSEAERVNKAAYVRKAVHTLGRKAPTEAIIRECLDQYGVTVSKSNVYATKHAMDVAKRAGKKLPRAPRRDKGVPRKNGNGGPYFAKPARQSDPAVHVPGDGDINVTDLKAAREYLEVFGYDTARAIRSLAVVTNLLGGSVEALRESVRQES